MRRILPIAFLLVATLAAYPATQALEPFTAEDALKVTSYSVLDLTEDGSRVAVSARRVYDNATTDHRRYGDPTYVAPSMVDLLVIDTRTGETQTILDRLMNVRQAAWSRDGGRLAVLTAEEDGEGLPQTTVWTWAPGAKAATAVSLGDGARVAANSELHWLPDGSRLLVALRDEALDRAAQKRFREVVDGPVYVHTSDEPFLEFDELRRADRTRALATIDPATGEARQVLPAAGVTSYQLARDGSFVTFLEDATGKTNYDVIFGTENAVKHLPLGGGEARTVVEAKTIKTVTPRWSDDGRLMAWAEKGEVFVQGVDETAPRSITPKPKKDADAPPPSAEEKKDEESFAAGPFSRDGSYVLVTSKKGWYVVRLTDLSKRQVLTLDPEREERNPRVSVLDWTPDGSALVVQFGEPDRWERGVVRLDVQTGQMTPLVKDRHLYQNIRVSRDGSTAVFLRSDGDRPAELHVAEGRFAGVRRLTDRNDWVARKAVPASELVSYRDADGKLLYGVLRYPVGYEKGKAYPTIFEIYETFFDNGFNARAAFLANHGYAVFHPSVNLVVGRPGESWAKGVTAAANKLIDMGVADPDRLGVHGTSYGGYATALLLTWTDRFKAAINISGKVNMVSFYTDSPRLGVRNTHAPEKSQDRIGGTLWEYPERYLEHSAVMRADRITTPLLNITGDQDPNVPASQSREIYYALRRLGKPVEWVRYVNGGHRPPNSVAESVDFEERILGWYDKYLKEKVESSQ